MAFENDDPQEVTIDGVDPVASGVNGDDDLHKEPERKTSTEGGDILLSKIQVIISPRHDEESDEESEEESEEEEEEEMGNNKKMVRKNAGAPKPAEVLTKTLAQAMRLINEQKVSTLL